MSQTLGIKFNEYGQIYYFSSGPFVVEVGKSVIVRTEQGMGLGKVVTVRPEDEDFSEDERSVIYRLANDKDIESQEENNTLARQAHDYCRTCIRKHGLEMKLVDVEVFFDRSKMIFFFTAPGRIDFRELIKDLVREYRTRIELRQIGVRHETQMLGAIGNCGQLCCCRRFMRKFVPVTIKMAKEQNLFLNPTKISGICGRLLCCLAFEQEGYEEFRKKCPKIGKRYQTSLGPVKVIRSNFFKKMLTLFLDDGSEREVSVDDWQDLLNKPVAAGSDSKSRSDSREGGKNRPSGQAKEGSGKSEKSTGQKTSSAPKGKGDASQDKPRKSDSRGSRRPRKRRRRPKSNKS